MKTNKGLIWVAALAMLIAGTAAGLASDKADAAEGGHHAGKYGLGPLQAEMEKLNLTADQSQQVASIIKLNRDAMKTTRSEWSEARRELESRIQAAEFDEAAVRSACRKAAAAGEEFAVQRAKIASQIRAVLTSEQQAELDKLRAEARSTKAKRFTKEHDAPGE